MNLQLRVVEPAFLGEDINLGGVFVTQLTSVAFRVSFVWRLGAVGVVNYHYVLLFWPEAQTHFVLTKEKPVQLYVFLQLP